MLLFDFVYDLSGDYDTQYFLPLGGIMAAEVYLFRWYIVTFCPAVHQYTWFANSSFHTLCLVCYFQSPFWIVPFNFRINTCCKTWRKCLDIFYLVAVLWKTNQTTILGCMILVHRSIAQSIRQTCILWIQRFKSNLSVY